MRNLTNGTATVAVLAVIGLIFCVNEAQARVVLATRGPRYQAAPSLHEIVLEGGLAEPMGDQGDDYFTTDTGFGAGTGYQLGVRWRQYLGESLAVSPVFQYTRFGTDTGLNGSEPYYRRTSMSRFGVDFQAFMGAGGEPVRLFLTGGLALVNNRLRDEDRYSYYVDSVNSPALSAGLGVKLRNIELVGEYTYNRFDTSKFSEPETRTYNWDTLVVRMGFSFGR